MSENSAGERNLFQKTLARSNQGRPPVWFMRQAGRYHSHYQKLRARHSFMDLCKKPELATEVTMGPIEDFDFDAAILFSDLLFPLEALGLGLTYDPSPKLAWHLEIKEDLRKLRLPSKSQGRPAQFMEFQAQALRQLTQRLPSSKGLIGFVGGPFTLFCYAVEGSHAGGLESSRKGLTDGRFQGFLEALVEMLADNMALQAEAGAQAVAMFDTCGGEVDAQTYGQWVVPAIEQVLVRFKKRHPSTPVIYYSKKTDPEHWRKLQGLPIDCLGVDWRHDLASVIREFGGQYAIQGNIDPNWLHLPTDELERRIRDVFSTLKGLDLSGWICGLGHGVLQHTPEQNVRRFLAVQKEVFSSW